MAQCGNPHPAAYVPELLESAVANSPGEVNVGAIHGCPRCCPGRAYQVLVCRELSRDWPSGPGVKLNTVGLAITHLAEGTYFSLSPRGRGSGRGGLGATKHLVPRKELAAATPLPAPLPQAARAARGPLANACPVCVRWTAFGSRLREPAERERWHNESSALLTRPLIRLPTPSRYEEEYGRR